MDIRCHYPLEPLPCTFTPWISITDPRFGIMDPKLTVSEVAIGANELSTSNPVFCRWLLGLGLHVYEIRMFRSWPYAEYKLHVDVAPNFPLEKTSFKLVDSVKHVYDGLVKLNFIYNSHGSTMTWYDLKDGSTARQFLNNNGYASFSFEKQDCDVVYHTDCDTHCLVNGGRIHTLTNGQNNASARLCYSMMIQNKDQTLTWDRAVEMLTPWFDV